VTRLIQSAGGWLKQFWEEWIKPFAIQWFYSFLLAITAWGSMLWFLHIDFRQSVEEIHRNNDQLVTVLEEHVRRSIRNVDDNLRLVKSEVERSGKMTPMIEDMFEQVNNHPFMINLFIADAAGRGRSTSKLSFEQTSVAESEYFVALKNQSSPEPFIGKPHVGRVTGKQSVVIARSLKDQSGSFAGTVAIALSPDYFSRFYQNIELEPGRVIRVVGKDGIVRASLDDEIKSLGHSLAKGSLFEEIQKAPTGKYLSGGKIFGVYRYYSYRSMPDFPLVVQVGKDRDTALSAHRERRNLYVISGILGTTTLFLYTTGLVWMMHRRKRDADRWKLAVEATNDGIWDWEAKTDRMYYSPRWKAILGHQEDEVGNTLKEWARRIHRDDRGKVRSAIERHLRGDAPLYQSENRLRSKDGSYRWVRCRGRVLRNTRGEIVRMVGAMSDISDEKKAERILRHDAEVARRLQRRLLPKISESIYAEIRTIYHPLQYVSGDLYFLDWRYDNNVLRGYLADVTGHGIGTALYTAALNVLLHEVNEMDLPLGAQVRWLNIQASRYFDEGSFAALLAFEVDIQAKELRYVGAGITEIWVDTAAHQGRVPIQGMFLGIDKQEVFPTHTIPLHEGDNIYVLTDGFSDLMRDRSGIPYDRFGEMHGLLGQLLKLPDCRDDATAILIHIKEQSESAGTGPVWPRHIQLSGYGDYMRRKEELAKLLEKWTGQVHSIQEIAVNEAIVNALECRDGLGRPYRARVKVNCIGNRLIVRVRTSRIAFAGNAVLDRLRSMPEDVFSYGLHETMGRGIPMMLKLSDKMTYNQDGTEVMLVWMRKKATQ
jgi:PAS domain S-box-containing protein